MILKAKLGRIIPSLCFVIVGTLPVVADVPGITNFDQVDTHVYRGAQPTHDGFHYLANLGVKTIIDLREAGERSKAEEQIVRESGMEYVNVPMTGLTPPSEAELLRILPILESTSTGPVFVHCKAGRDRTGAVIAAYHINHDHWDNARALRDAKAHKMGFYQLPRQNFIKTFRPLTIEASASSEPAPLTN